MKLSDSYFVQKMPTTGTHPKPLQYGTYYQTHNQ